MTEVPQCPKDWRVRPLDDRCVVSLISKRHSCFLDAGHKDRCQCACGSEPFVVTREESSA